MNKMDVTQPKTENPYAVRTLRIELRDVPRFRKIKARHNLSNDQSTIKLLLDRYYENENLSDDAESNVSIWQQQQQDSTLKRPKDNAGATSNSSVQETETAYSLFDIKQELDFSTPCVQLSDIFGNDTFSKESNATSVGSSRKRTGKNLHSSNNGKSSGKKVSSLSVKVEQDKYESEKDLPRNQNEKQTRKSQRKKKRKSYNDMLELSDSETETETETGFGRYSESCYHSRKSSNKKRAKQKDSSEKEKNGTDGDSSGDTASAKEGEEEVVASDPDYDPEVDSSSQVSATDMPAKLDDFTTSASETTQDSEMERIEKMKTVKNYNEDWRLVPVKEADLHVCCLCFKPFFDDKKLVYHYCKFHESITRNEVRAKCYTIPVSDFLREETVQSDDENPDGLKYTCLHCGRKQMSRRVAAGHVRISMDGKASCVKLCPKGGAFRDPGIRHTRSKMTFLLKRASCVCHMCGEEVSVGFQLEKHLLLVHNMTSTSTDKKVHVCDVCGKVFKSACFLQYHTASHSSSPENKMLCHICGKELSFYALPRHIQRHQVLQCPQCPKTFSNPYVMATHVRRHRGETPYHCSVCGKDFSNNYNLKTHFRIHSGERPYRCQLCECAFAQKTSLDVHMKKHK